MLTGCASDTGHRTQQRVKLKLKLRRRVSDEEESRIITPRICLAEPSPSPSPSSQIWHVFKLPASHFGSFKMTRFFFLLVVLVVSARGQNEEAKCEYHYRSGDYGAFAIRGDRIVSPNYPDGYPPFFNCSYYILAQRGERIKLSLVSVDLQMSQTSQPLCVLDKLDIFELNEDGQTEHFHRLCELKESPSAINSVGNTVIIHFVALSDNRGRHAGFHIDFEFTKVTETQLPARADSLCPGPGPRRPFGGYGGVVTSPGFPNEYYGNVECVWTVQVPRGQRILIAFSYLYLGTRIYCTNQYVALYDGMVSSFENRAPDTTLCGYVYRHDKDTREFLSSTQSVTIRFVSGPPRTFTKPKGSKNYEEQGVQGFRLVWTAVALANGSHERRTFSLADDAAKWPGERGYAELQEERQSTKVTCAGFVCRGPVFCHDSNQLMCEYLPKYCIDKSLECDNVVHCGTFDESDEDSCPGRIIAVSMYSIAAGIGLSLIAVGAFFVAWRSHRHRQRNAHTSLRNDCVAFLGTCMQLRLLRQQCTRIRSDSMPEVNDVPNVAVAVAANCAAFRRPSADHFELSADMNDTAKNYHAVAASPRERQETNKKDTCVVLQNPAYCESQPSASPAM